ncbi:hypothetical protein COO60DRAFT_1511049, partial [Scenedesmus sp. NREL 46B-D3]
TCVWWCITSPCVHLSEAAAATAAAFGGVTSAALAFSEGWRQCCCKCVGCWCAAAAHHHLFRCVTAAFPCLASNVCTMLLLVLWLSSARLALHGGVMRVWLIVAIVGGWCWCGRRQPQRVVACVRVLLHCLARCRAWTAAGNGAVLCRSMYITMS